MKNYHFCHILQSYMPQKLPHLMYNHQISHRHVPIADPSLQTMLPLWDIFQVICQRSKRGQHENLQFVSYFAVLHATKVVTLDV